MKADNQLTEAIISGYKIVSKKVMREGNGWESILSSMYHIYFGRAVFEFITSLFLHCILHCIFEKKDIEK